jgi:plastocyanin
MNRKYQWSLLLAAALVITATGCGNKSSSESTTSDNGSGPAMTASVGKTVDPTTAGEVSGTVTLDGAAPKMKAINMSQEAACASQHSTPALSEEVVTGDKGALANVIVYVTSGAEGYAFTPPSDPVEIDQKGCQYHPHVLGLQASQPLSVVNDDPTTHNIHPVPKDNREWNESQPPGSAPISQTFARPEVPIPVKCNVHPWMKAYIGVFANPYFQVTGKDGAFDLKNLPPGTYTLVAWQELYGASDPQTVTIGPKESKTVNFVFKATAGAD